MPARNQPFSQVFEQRIYMPKRLPPTACVDLVFNLSRGKVLKDRPDPDLEGAAWLVDKRFLQSTPDNVLRLRLDRLD